MANSTIIQTLEMMRDITGGYQHTWYDDIVKAAKVVEVVSVRDVLTPEQYARYTRFVKPKLAKKMCYKNATIMTQEFGFEYVEGQVAFHGIPIDHAFNKVGDKYIDVTAEELLDGLFEEYVSFGEYSLQTTCEVILENGFYGDVYRTLYIKQNSKTK